MDVMKLLSELKARKAAKRIEAKKRKTKTYYIKDEVHQEYKILCDKLGVSMSASLEQLMLNAVEESRGQ